MNDLDVCLEVV